MTRTPAPQKAPPPIDQLEPVTTGQVARARQVCATNAHGPADLALLLAALGIGPGWEQTWRGPVVAE